MNSDDAGEQEQANPSPLQERLMDYVKAVNENRDEEAEGMLFGVLASAVEDAMANPSPQLVWTNLATECEDLGNWVAAEDARKKAVEITLADPNTALSVKPLLDLSRLYQMLGRQEEARAHAEKALAPARESGISTLVLMVLESRYQLGLAGRELKDIQEAAAAGFDSLPNERMYNLTKARFLLLQAQCAVASGDLEFAETQVLRAQELVGERKPSAIMAGYQWFHSRAAELSATIHAARCEFTEAIAAFLKSLERERAIDALPQVHSFRSRYRLAVALLTYATHLEAGGRLDDAATARTEADELLREIKLPHPRQSK